MSALNERRHQPDLIVRDQDLLTGRDARRLIAQEVREWLATYDAEKRQQRTAGEAAFAALPWWKRVWLRLTIKVVTP